MVLLAGTTEYYVITFKQDYLHATLRMMTYMGYIKTTRNFRVYLNNTNRLNT